MCAILLKMNRQRPIYNIIIYYKVLGLRTNDGGNAGAYVLPSLNIYGCYRYQQAKVLLSLIRKPLRVVFA